MLKNSENVKKGIDSLPTRVILNSIKRVTEKEKHNITSRRERKIMYRIITDERKEIKRTETYEGCNNYWEACNGIYEDETVEHYIYIEEIA